MCSSVAKCNSAIEKANQKFYLAFFCPGAFKSKPEKLEKAIILKAELLQSSHRLRPYCMVLLDNYRITSKTFYMLSSYTAVFFLMRTLKRSGKRLKIAQRHIDAVLARQVDFVVNGVFFCFSQIVLKPQVRIGDKEDLLRSELFHLRQLQALFSNARNAILRPPLSAMFSPNVRLPFSLTPVCWSTMASYCSTKHCNLLSNLSFVVVGLVSIQVVQGADFVEVMGNLVAGEGAQAAQGDVGGNGWVKFGRLKEASKNNY
ncbi:hypothetical protein TYRP_014680 [Tyrophagus putrescentiae]|nr:hypothetical protein TYRP_014680 [Tyrophagus putrescentiae]